MVSRSWTRHLTFTVPVPITQLYYGFWQIVKRVAWQNAWTKFSELAVSHLVGSRNPSHYMLLLVPGAMSQLCLGGLTDLTLQAF